MASKTEESATASAARRPVSEQAPTLTGLLAEPRRMKILEWLQEEGSARVRELSTAFRVSEATIRQDLERLEQDGYVLREHGAFAAFPKGCEISKGFLPVRDTEELRAA